MALGATCLLAAPAWLGCAHEPTPEGYYEALRAMRFNAKTEGGLRYRMAGEQILEGKAVEAERKCRRLRVPDKRSSILLYRLGAEAEVLESIVFPETPFALCIHEELGGLGLPPPPRPDYWIGLEIPGLPPGT